MCGGTLLTFVRVVADAGYDFVSNRNLLLDTQHIVVSMIKIPEPTYTYIHTYTYTYIHTHIRTYIHIYIHITYIHTSISYCMVASANICREARAAIQ